MADIKNTDRNERKPSGKPESVQEREHLSELAGEGEAKSVLGALADSLLSGRVSQQIEDQLGRVSGGGYLGGALGAAGLSILLALTTERKGLAYFVGNWVPALVCLAVYGKLTQLERLAREVEEPHPEAVVH